ncbi:hypothetical protein GOODEAATRI_011128, partial [Goodea atripinnis]
VPEDMQDKEFAAILQDEPMQPLALVPLTEEEQRNFSMSVNSAAVLRLMGKGVGGAAPAGVVRGRGATRGGRGRGRGEGGFYQRSIEDTEVGFSRSVREIHRSQSWDDRFEESSGPAGPVRKEYTRADSDNWRTLREEQEEDEGEPGTNWRLSGARRDDGGPRSAGWRDHIGPGEGRRRKFDFDFRDSEGHGAGRRRAGSEGLEDDRDGLPEWCTDEEDGEMGTFDSSGAFMPMKEAEKMVASLQDTSLEEECFTQALQQQQESRNTAAALPLSHEAAMKWFYKDPQGEIQGPFTTVEMCEWFQAGYFSMTLLVKRGCDEGFQPLGDVIKMWGRVPFAPGPSPPPLLVRQLPPTQRTQPSRGSAGTERRDAELRAKRDEEEQRKRREEKRRQQEEQKRREEEELYRRKQRQQQELLMKLLQQQAPQQQGPGVGGSGWSSAPSSGLSKAGKSLTMLEMQEAERILKQQQQRAQQQRVSFSCVSGMKVGCWSSSMGGQWADGVGMWGGPGGLEGKGGSGGSSSSMGMWDEAVKNQAGLRGSANNNLGLKNSRSSPSLTYVMLNR